MNEDITRDIQRGMLKAIVKRRWFERLKQ